MRITLRLSSNTDNVAFNYQNKLVGTFHKWLGNNSIHDGLSLYSFSWLQNGKFENGTLNFPDGAIWHISSHDTALIKNLIRGIQKDTSVAFGMNVISMTIQESPIHKNPTTFYLGSPVFIKRTINKEHKFYLYTDNESNNLMTQTLKHKLKFAGLESDSVQVEFIKDFEKIGTKKINYNGINIKASYCPVRIYGTPEQIAFAWNVGIGNSTGIGFGFLM
ncbi:MAG: CRISPR-associated endoribonuclease Cas6 [Chitinophagales bacterium]|nr:CRISPR-associated endoribonuclease Cas6 [Chitinophagales bacterium]